MTIRRERNVSAAPDHVWQVIADPERLPAWWPGVERVEEASAAAWTKVLVSRTGKTVRADYSRVEAEPPRRALWRHEVAESPFERILSESLTEIELEQAGGATRVVISAHLRPRGLARFGSFQLRMATRRQLEGALDGLERLFGERED